MTRRKNKKPGSGGRPAGEDKLPINKNFAERYEATERRKLFNSGKYLPPELQEPDPNESSSSEEDEFGELLTKGIDRKVRDTILALQSKDPRIYDKEVFFFDKPEQPAGKAGGKGGGGKADGGDDDDDDDDSDVASEDEPVAGWDTIAAAAKNDTPSYTVKDYVRENLLEHGKLSDEESGEEEGNEDDGEEDDDDDDEVDGQADGEADSKKGKKSKRGLASTEDDDGGGDNADGDGDDGDDDGGGSEDDFFTKREKTKDELEEEERDFQTFLSKQVRKKSEKTGDDLLLHSYLEKETPDEKEQFLRDFVLNNGWLDKNRGDAPAAGDYSIEVDLPKPDGDEDEDEEGGGKADPEEEFEDRNDAFEAKYNFRFEEEGADQIATHARHVPDSLRRPDERRKQARAARRERKQREKAQKTEELKRVKNEKKREIKARLLAIREAAGEDVDVGGLDLDGDFDADKFNAEMERRFGDDYYARGDDELADGLDKGAELASEKRVKSDETEQASDEVRRDVDRLMDEYYNLDFEDIVGGTPVRFKYKQVDPETFGMSTEDILAMDDKELNRTVSLKYLAPYRSRRDVQKQAWKARAKLNKRTTVKRARDEPSASADAPPEPEPESASQRKRKKRKKGKKGGDEELVVVEDREGAAHDAVGQAAD